MKKSFIILIIALIFSFLNVKALEPSKLIGVNERVTIDTEIFTYNNLYFVDNNGNKTIYFDSINNKLTKKAPISFSIGLFDQENKNIGLINYCSSEDLDSAFANYYLPASGYTAFNLNILAKYLVDGESSANIYSIAFLDSNKYCKIGGADNYKGSSYEQIIAGEAVMKNKPSVLKTLIKEGILKNIIYCILLIMVYLVYCNLIDNLYRSIKGHSSNLVYVPIINIYLSSQLAFGQIIAIGYLILTVLGIGLVFMDFKLLLYIMIFLNIISFIVIIIKLITKKYDLFIFSFKEKDLEEEPVDKYSIDEKEVRANFLQNKKEELEEEKIKSVDSFEEVNTETDKDNAVKKNKKDKNKSKGKKEKKEEITEEENNNSNSDDEDINYLNHFFK